MKLKLDEEKTKRLGITLSCFFGGIGTDFDCSLPRGQRAPSVRNFYCAPRLCGRRVWLQKSVGKSG